jgi:serine protease Do
MLELLHKYKSILESRGIMMKNNRIAVVLICLLLVITINLWGCTIEFSTFDSQQLPQAKTSALPSEKSASPIDPKWVVPSVNNNMPILPNFADVVEKAYPSVVAIDIEAIALDLFSRPRTQKGSGSGWVLDSSGNRCIFVTNNHVVEGAQKVTIKMFDGKTIQVDPSSVKSDSVSDLAVIVVNNLNLTAAPIGDSSKLRVGDWVMALGNPLGQGLRAKEGTVSGLKVSLTVDQNETLYDLIEVSAAINPGNSGGPLLNLAGQVIGITSAKIASVGVEGMGYAISMNTAKPMIEQLIKQGYVTRPVMGIGPVTVDDYVATVNRLPINKGVILSDVSANGPAAQAGLKRLDIITQFNDREVTTAEMLIQYVRSSRIGETVKITYVRGKETRTAMVTLQESNSGKTN